MAFEKPTSISSSNVLAGRTVLYSSIDEDSLNPITIIQVLKDVLPVHFDNAKEIDYLKGVYKGVQDVLLKKKLVRPEINHKVVENNAYHIVEFKKGFVFGEPIQYVHRGDTGKDEVDALNDYMAMVNKSSLDVDLSEDWYVCGTAYRMAFPNSSDEQPFDIYNANPKNAFVVYDSGIEEKQIMGGYIALRKDYLNDSFFYIITVYTNRNIYTFKTKTDKIEKNKEIDIEYIPESLQSVENNYLGHIPIVEYPLNKSRLGIIELVLSSMNTLNLITSNDIDGIEQFIQAMLVFTNVEIDEAEFAKMRQAGALMLHSIKDAHSDGATVDLLTNQLSHTETKVLYDRIYNNMLTIAGVPRMTDKASSGDTGQARLIGEGWTMADQRAKQDELAFKKSEKKLLNNILSFLRVRKNIPINDLKMSSIDIKFTRNKSDNMLVKSEALQMLKQAQVAPEVAFNVVGLFSDSNDVYAKSKEFFGDTFWKEIENAVSKEPTENTDTQTVE